MKKIYGILFILVILSGCQKKLVENPQSTLTPAFFLTAQGFQSGLDAAYAGNRIIWGPMDYFTLTVPGTDEFITGNDGNNDINKYNSNYIPSNGNVTNVWKACYPFINTCNGIIDNASSITGIDTATLSRMVGEAKFLRANYYFILTQFWGSVTLLDHYQTSATTSATRAPLADIYTFIIKDLTDAINVLPASPLTTGVLPGKATQAAAIHLLSKVYLSRAGSSAKQADDYKNAYTNALNLINNVAPATGLKLLQDFGKVYAEGNEASSEVLWSIQHTTSLAYNGSAAQNNSGPDNLLCHLWVPQYETQPGMQRDVKYGRPYIRVVPTKWLLDTVFQERVNDTRYSKTFQTVWLCNNTASVPKNTDGTPKFSLGDTAIWMPGYNITDDQIATYRYQVIPPRKYSIKLAPAMMKYFDTKRSDQNAPSIRPIIVFRLAETYLIAAEALLMDGRAADALPYINAIRERAAYPTGNAAAMDVQASDLSLDFILDERSRELCGELMRWPDLVRTGQLITRVVQHNSDGRNNIISPKHLLRPVPQAQIDAVTTGDPYPQNPGW